MSSAASSSGRRPVPALEARQKAVARLLRSLGTAEREAFAVSIGDGAGASDDVDRASSAQGRDSVALMAEVLSTNRDQIDHAMERIAHGGYGFCEDCGGRIPAERLKAVVDATRCIECQRHDEQELLSAM